LLRRRFSFRSDGSGDVDTYSSERATVPGGNGFEAVVLNGLASERATGPRLAARNLAYRPNRLDQRVLAFDRFEALNIDFSDTVKDTAIRRIFSAWFANRHY
jgi:hypothetical protein